MQLYMSAHMSFMLVCTSTHICILGNDTPLYSTVNPMESCLLQVGTCLVWFPYDCLKKKAKLMNRKRKVVTWECLDWMKNAAQQPNFYFHLLWRLNSLFWDLFSKGLASNVIATVGCTWATKHRWSYFKTHAMVWLRHLDHISPWRGRRGAHTNPVTGGHQQPQQPECQPGSTHSVTMEENCWSRFKSHTSRWLLPESRMDEGGCSSQRCLQGKRSTGTVTEHF